MQSLGAIKGAAFNAEGTYGEAILALDKAIEIDPKNAEAWSNKGVALLMTKASTMRTSRHTIKPSRSIHNMHQPNTTKAILFMAKASTTNS